jgi:hypothetical protein
MPPDRSIVQRSCVIPAGDRQQSRLYAASPVGDRAPTDTTIRRVDSMVTPQAHLLRDS